MQPLKAKDLSREAKVYLSAATTTWFAVPSLDVGVWTRGHGEGRSTARVSFHTQWMKMSTGGIRTCLSYKYLRNKEVFMKETEKDWTEEVQPAEVLDAYKEMYGVEEAPKQKKDK